MAAPHPWQAAMAHPKPALLKAADSLPDFLEAQGSVPPETTGIQLKACPGDAALIAQPYILVFKGLGKVG